MKSFKQVLKENKNSAGYYHFPNGGKDGNHEGPYNHINVRALIKLKGHKPEHFMYHDGKGNWSEIHHETLKPLKESYNYPDEPDTTYTPEVGHKVRIKRGTLKGTTGTVTKNVSGRYAEVDNKFGNIRYHHDDLEHVKEGEEIEEMSSDRLHNYINAARADYSSKLNTNRAKSIKRAKFVQKAEIKIANEELDKHLGKYVKEDAVVATNCVGGGHIAGANQDPPGPSKLIKRLRKPILRGPV